MRLNGFLFQSPTGHSKLCTIEKRPKLIFPSRNTHQRAQESIRMVRYPLLRLLVRHRVTLTFDRSRTFPGSSSKQSPPSAANPPSPSSPSPLEPSKISQKKRLYKSVTISQANQVNKRDYRLLQTLASSSDQARRANRVQFFLVEFGAYREKVGDALCDVLDVVKKMMGLEVVGHDDTAKVDVAGAVKTPAPAGRTWDATELALKALETMSSLTDLRVKVRKGASRLTPELNRIISAGPFKLKTLFCDSRLDLKALIKAHRSTLEVLVVWMWNGYNATADLTPFMQPAPTSSGLDQNPSLIVAGLEPIDSASRSEDAIMLFPKYMAVKGEAEESGAPSGRTLGEALDILKTAFARDTRAREGIRLGNMTTVICCFESLSGAGVNTSFTRSIARHCTLVKEFVIYYDKFGGLLSNTLAKSLPSFRKLEVLYVHGWNPHRLGAKWKKVPRAEIIEFATKCGGRRVRR
ncbi:hypothetical protein BKA70DRAFT_1441109 [Coprinopsis sp. MPI-PUGE-AT-0042]|nr:hypothetical protein BKA70DRAFT_1441109 [Coprinopsis sp. MPI-PUGE-AT-0042]